MSVHHARAASAWRRAAAGTFTLIELLVVVAIIAILAAMLLPALGKARGKAKESACYNNLKQIAMVAQSYQDDFDEWVPSSLSGAAYGGHPYADYLVVLQNYQEHDEVNTWGTNSSASAAQHFARMNLAQYLCPSDGNTTHTLPGPWNDKRAMSYGRCLYTFNTLGSLQVAGGNQFTPFRMTIVPRSPSDVIFVGEGGEFNLQVGLVINATTHEYQSAANNYIIFRHPSFGATMTFGDGHVETVTLASQARYGRCGLSWNWTTLP